MATDTNEATRRIMDTLGEESRVPYLNVREGDMGVLLGFPLAGLLVAGFSGVSELFIPLVVGGLGFGFGVVFVSPDHLSATAWLRDVYRHLKRPTITYNVPEMRTDGAGEDHVRNEGGLANYTPFEPDERAQDLTDVEMAWPGAGAVERADGAMEGFVELTPDNMDFAMSDDWHQLQEITAEFANRELDHALTVHATTRSFPVERLVDRIDERLTDEDVKQNPVFEQLLLEYRDRRPEEMRERGTQQMRFFLGVEVDRLEVYDRYDDERTPAEKLTELPILGFLFNPFVTRRESFTDAEVRAEMFELLDERLRNVHAELVQSVPGWSGRRLSTVELFVLNAEFWNGEEHDYGDVEGVVGTRSASASQRRSGDDA